MNKSIYPIIYSILIVIGILIGVSLTPNNNFTSQNDKINSLIKMIKNNYVDSVKIDHFENDFINSFLNKLDPHSRYISSEKFKSINENMQGKFSGIGIEFNILSDTIVVVSPISGGPSEKLGIISGDRIISVNGENMTNISITNEIVIDKLRGEKGTTVSIKIFRRFNKEILDFNIVRDDIPLKSIDASLMLENNIGFIKINRFSLTTHEEFSNEIKKLLSNGMKKLILDFRGNPGGSLSSAIYICDEFFKENKLLLFTMGRNRERQDYYSSKNGDLKNIDLAILIDEGSASASEIIAGAVQDNDRGIIIGRTSFGKGLIQEELTLSDGSAIHITTQRYYTPSGRSIQRSYEKSYSEYYLEPYKNEINQNDSLQFKTSKGRIVFAGGGITPDIILKPNDSLNFSKINYFLNSGLITEFVLIKSDELKYKYTKNKFAKELSNKSIVQSFEKFILLKSGDPNFDLKQNEKSYLGRLLKANISRSIWDNNMYYSVMIENDEFVKTAIKKFESNHSIITN